MLKKIIHSLRKVKKHIKDARSVHSHSYLEEFDHYGETMVYVKVVGTYRPVSMSPNKILADDALTRCFDQTHIRTMAYFAYHNMLAPKYKVLLEKTDDNGEKLFVLREKGVKTPLIRTHEQMMTPEIRDNLDPKDSFSLGSIDVDREQARIKIILRKISKP